LAVSGGKKQSQTNPILFSPQIFWGLRTDLKKQSQFATGLKSVKSYMKGDYGKKLGPTGRKNKGIIPLTQENKKNIAAFLG
jgi:hypothetical protein